MKAIFNFISIVLIFILSGCSMFEPIDENLLGEDRLNSDPAFAEGLLLRGYQKMKYQRSDTDMATDDATHNNNSDQRRMATGEWSSDQTPTSRWEHYENILYVNKFIGAINNVQWSRDPVSNQLFIDRNYGEALALRALRHYWILEEHAGYSNDGVLLGVPYIDSWLEYNSNFDIPRLTFEQTIERILQDFDTALVYLPMDFDGDYAKRLERYAKVEKDKYEYIFGEFHNHRISGRIIKAYKAKLHLLAASPAFLNGAGGHYEKAATLVAELLNDNGGLDGLDMNGHHNFYTVVEDDLKEYFWRKGGGINLNSTDFEKNNFPPSLRGDGRINPSQNLVDAFYMSNGYPATPENGYDANNPYANRDSRLKRYVLYDGNDLAGRVIRTGITGGIDGVNAVFERSTRTGYYIKKHIWQNVNFEPGSSTAVRKRDFLIRYTELYLLLAEAANEIGGPEHEVGGMSAAQIIRKIRNRALNIASDPYLDEVISGGKLAMQQLIRNERRLELCFEGHRFYDLRRWSLLNSTLSDIEGVFYDGATYRIIDVEPRDFPDYANYAPIPRGESLKFPSLKQNRGW